MKKTPKRLPKKINGVLLHLNIFLLIEYYWGYKKITG